MPDQKPYIPAEEFMAPVSVHARRWAKVKFAAHFPLLTGDTLPPRSLPRSPPGSPPGSPPNETQPAAPTGLTPDLLALLTRLAASGAAGLLESATRREPQEEKKEEDGGTSPKLTGEELRVTLQMCGAPADGTVDDLPAWFQLVNERGTSEHFKLTQIQKHIMDNVHFEDAEVPITTPLLKMALKRNWVGKDSNISRPSLLYANEGLSPFICLDLNEDEVAEINKDEEALQMATNISLADAKAHKSKFTAKVPQEGLEFLMLLKRFANLLFALFSNQCPLFKSVLTLIAALRNTSKQACDGITLKAKASILWIILLQSRQFGFGSNAVLCEFQRLQEKLEAREFNIVHAECPSKLYDMPKATKRPREEENKDIAKDSKRQKEDPWHPKLKLALEHPLHTTGHPAKSKIMRYCGKSTEELYSILKDRCSPYVVTGRCWGAKCQRSHKTVTDREADDILSMLKPFLDNPLGINQG